MSPLLPVRPHRRFTPWGGSYLAGIEGVAAGPAGEPLGELLDASALPGMSSIIEGSGETLSAAYAADPQAMAGPAAGGEFPLLVKRVDSREFMSIQVHPDDAQAQRLSQKPRGKNEAWIVLHAELGAEILLGFEDGVTKDDVRRAVADGTLPGLMRRVNVKTGDVFGVPTGCVHAIGGGIVIFEPQQPADITYRLFDWNRTRNGQARELHVDQALEVLDVSLRPDRIAPRPLASTPALEREELVAMQPFRCERWRLAGESTFDVSSLWVLHILEGDVEFRSADGMSCRRSRHRSLIVPYAARTLSMRASTSAEILAVTPWS